jgi:hypothetical protein
MCKKILPKYNELKITTKYLYYILCNNEQNMEICPNATILKWRILDLSLKSTTTTISKNLTTSSTNEYIEETEELLHITGTTTVNFFTANDDTFNALYAVISGVPVILIFLFALFWRHRRRKPNISSKQGKYIGNFENNNIPLDHIEASEVEATQNCDLEICEL